MSILSHNKRLLALLIVLAFGIGLISQQLFNIPIIVGSIEKVTWKTFKDSAGLFSIQYPSKWIPTNVSDPLGPIDVQFWYDSGNNDSFAYVSVYSSPNSPFSTSLEMIEDEQIPQQVSAGVNYRLEQGIECDTYVINEAQGCSFIFLTSYTDERQTQNVLAVDAVDNQTVIEYAMVLAASQDVFEQFKPAFDHMVKSFELNSTSLVG
jgi:hypothetical protein